MTKFGKWKSQNEGSKETGRARIQKLKTFLEVDGQVTSTLMSIEFEVRQDLNL